MSVTLRELVVDLADALAAVDATRVSYKNYQPGIGPFAENQAVRAALKWLKHQQPFRYNKAATKTTPDLLLPGQWAAEVKIIRPFNDNGTAAEHWSENILHPYPGNISSLGDCLKLLASGHPERKAVLIIGYEHTPPRVPLEPALRAFETLAHSILSLHLSSRVQEDRVNLVHPEHEQLSVCGYEILNMAATDA